MKVVFFQVFVAIACCVGCSNTNVPLGGTVTFSDDGSPVPAGTVCFENGAKYARGQLDENGRYTLGFEKEGNGLPPGVYGVCVIGAVRSLGPSEETVSLPGSTGPGLTVSRMRLEELVARKFQASSTSGITCTVDGSTKTFDFKVDRAQAGAKPR